MGAFPAEPSLDQRGRDDGVGDRYLNMERRGEIRAYPGRVTPVAAFLRDVAQRVKGEKVRRVGADHFLKERVKQALAYAGINWPFEWRRVGEGEHGIADVTYFQMEVLDDHLRVEPSLVFTSAISDSVVIRNNNGNPRLDKSRKRGKNDILQAAIHAVSQGPPGGASRRARWSRGRPRTTFFQQAALRREPDPRDQRIRRPAVRR